MSESHPTPPQPPAELHWGISYLREDIQDLRRDTHAGFQELRHEIRRLDGRIDQTNQRLDERHEQQLQRLDNRFLWMMTTMIALSGVVIAVIKMG